MKHLKYYIFSLAIIAIMALGLGIHQAKAGPLFFPVTCQTASATTSVNYLSPGLGTTTLSCNAYSNSPTAVMRGALLIQYAGTSTTSTLRVNKEYSQDNIDWYQDGGDLTGGFGTTTKPFDIGQVNQYALGFASSTAGLAAVTNANSATTTRIIYVNTPTHYIRFIFSIPIGAGITGGAVWAQFVPLKELPNNG